MQEQAGTTLSRPSRSGALRLCLLVALGALVADQGSKLWALRVLDGGRVVPVLGDWLQLRLLFNPGAAFSLGSSMTWVMTVVSLAVTAVIVYLLRRLGSRPWAVALGLLLGGSVGNLIDRFARDPGPLRGHVVDFIDYGGLFVGNVADIAVVAAAVLLVWLVQTDTRIDGGRPRHRAEKEV